MSELQNKTVGFPTWDTCGNNLHNNDKGIHIVCCVLLCSTVLEGKSTSRRLDQNYCR